MARYIDADMDVSNYVTVWDCDCSEFGKQIVMAVDDLHYLPTADVAPRAEWISVDERLPEKSGRYLVYGSFAGMPLICGAHYDKYNGFGDDDFTHWMPLPEPPEGD